MHFANLNSLVMQDETN